MKTESAETLYRPSTRSMAVSCWSLPPARLTRAAWRTFYLSKGTCDTGTSRASHSLLTPHLRSQPEAGPQVPQAERDPIHPDVLPTSWCSGCIHRPLLRSRRREVQPQFVPPRGDHQPPRTLPVGSVSYPPTCSCIELSDFTAR